MRSLLGIVGFIIIFFTKSSHAFLLEMSTAENLDPRNVAKEANIILWQKSLLRVNEIPQQTNQPVKTIKVD